jgi:hypothetical protein
MSPEVASVIHACLAAAPGFEQLRDDVEALGFFETARLDSDIRWTHAEGHEVFLSYAASQTICSVWFDGEYQTGVADLASLLAKEGYPAKAYADQVGTAWRIDDNKLMRLAAREKDAKPKPAVDPRFRRLAENLQLVKKQGYEQRLCAALIVQRN